MSDEDIVSMDVDEEGPASAVTIHGDSSDSDATVDLDEGPSESDEVVTIDTVVVEVDSNNTEETGEITNITREAEIDSSSTQAPHISLSNATVDTEEIPATSTAPAVLAKSAVSIVSVSPVLKPNDISKGSPEDFKTKEKEASPKKSPTREDESENCPICFEPWSNSGSHRVSSLDCGHLFGRSCIERWLRTKGRAKCPQCNAPAKRKQIRNIYAKAIKAVDTYERDNALEELEKEKLARKKAEEAEAKVMLQFQLARAECDRIKVELEKKQKLLAEQAEVLYSAAKNRVNPSSSSASSSSQPTSSQGHVHHRYELEKCIPISQSGARVMAYNSFSSTLVVSKPSPNQLFPGFGVLKVSCHDTKCTEYFSIHDKTIRDAAFSNQNDSLLLTASVDKTLQISSIGSNCNVLTYHTPAPVWSCAWNTSDSNYVYGGLSNGQCYVFDTRNTTTHLRILKREEAGVCPLVSLAFVPRNVNSSFNPCGLLTCSLEGGCFWENTADTDYVPHLLRFPDGSSTCLRFEPTTRHFLVSQRPSRNCNRSHHTIMQLRGKGLYQSLSRYQQHQHLNADYPNDGLLCSAHPTVQCFGGSAQKLLAHSTLFTSPEDHSKLIACAGDEASKSVLLWDGSNGRLLQTLPHQGTVLDVCAFQRNNYNYLTTITERTLSFYRWK